MRILCFGDSITEGFHDTEGGGWCDRLKTHVFAKEVATDYSYDRTVINLGISGDTTGDILRRVKAETESRVLKFPTQTHDVLLLAVGVNDSMFAMESRANEVSLETFQKNLQEIQRLTSELVGQVVVVGIAPVVEERVQPMPWAPTLGYANTEIKRYDEALRQFASENGHVFIAMSDVFGNRIADYLPDGVHPNTAGHQLMFERIKLQLEAFDIL